VAAIRPYSLRSGNRDIWTMPDGAYLYFSWQEDLSDLWIAEPTR
jgi:hypothetical protein